MANWYVSSAGWTAVTAWAASTAYTVGQYRRQLATPAVGNERVFRCTTAGTSGGTEPTWTLTNNGTTNDGTVVWTQIGGQEAHQSAGNWTAPLARYATASGFGAADDTIFVSHDHAETQSTTLTFGSATQIRTVLCVSRTGASLPPTSADLATTGQISTTGGTNITIQGVYCYGLTFTAGNTTTAANITFSSTGITVILDKCALKLGGTNAASRINSSGTFQGIAVLQNTTVEFGNVSQRISMPDSGNLEWSGALSGIAGANIPTVLLQSAGGNSGRSSLLATGIDLSMLNTAIWASTNISGRIVFRDTRLHASLTLSTTNTSDSASYFLLHNCDDSTNNRNYRFQEVYHRGAVVSETGVIRAGGASDGVTGVSHRYYVSTSGTASEHLVGNFIGKRQNAVGSAVTMTVEAIAFTSTIPTNAQLWLDAQALTNSAYPQAEILSSGLSDRLATASNLSATTENWSGGVSARANSTVYAVGALCKVASNQGRVFVCTAGGTSSGSEPGGFASAVDGGVVADGGATWRAGWRVKMEKTFTPQTRGMVRARIHVNLSTTANALESTVFVDPKLTIV